MVNLEMGMGKNHEPATDSNAAYSTRERQGNSECNKESSSFEAVRERRLCVVLNVDHVAFFPFVFPIPCS